MSLDKDTRSIKVLTPRKVPGRRASQAVLWIRARTNFSRLVLDPDPGGQKWPTKTEKSEDISLLEVLDVSFEDIRLLIKLVRLSSRDKWIAIFDQQKINFFSCIYPIFGYRSLGSGSVYGFNLTGSATLRVGLGIKINCNFYWKIGLVFSCKILQFLNLK